MSFPPLIYPCYNVASTPWWMAAGVTPTIAYQPIGAASYAASKSNLANPGTYDATDGVAASWSAAAGWIFDGSTTYLKTGYTPSSRNCTVIVRFSNGQVYNSGSAYAVIGAYNSDAYEAQAIYPNDNGALTYCNGAVQSAGAAYSWLTTACVGFAGSNAYMMDGLAPITIGSGNIASYPFYIGATNYNNNPGSIWGGHIQAVWILDGTVLSTAQMRTQILAMLAMTATDIAQNSLRTAFMTQQLGAAIHWNMSTFTGMEVSNGNISLNTFAPTGFNPSQWMSSIAASGAKYCMLTTKHHDGFALWPTAYYVPTYSPYSIAGTSWYSSNGNPDVVGQFVSACNSNSITPNFYFSMWDKTFEARTGTTSLTNPSGYTAMIKSQLNELLSNYGSIGAIWTDGWGWQIGYQGVQWDDIYAYVKSIQPNCLFLENAHQHPAPRSQIETYETPVGVDGPIPSGNIRKCEEINTITTTGNWFWHSTSDTAKSAATVQSAINNAVSNNANYRLSVCPNQAGVIPSDQVTTLAGITP